MGKTRMTLKALRENAPPQDRNDPALVTTEQPHWATARDGGRYVTIGELRMMSRDYGDAAVAEVRWGAILSWLMRAYPAPDILGNPYTVASNAISLMQEYDRVRLGWPRWQADGTERVPPVLNGLSPEDRSKVERVAAETLTIWEAAGSPYIDPGRIKAAYQRLIASHAFQSKYVAADTAAHPTNKQDNL